MPPKKPARKNRQLDKEINDTVTALMGGGVRTMGPMPGMPAPAPGPMMPIPKKAKGKPKRTSAKKK